MKDEVTYIAKRYRKGKILCEQRLEAVEYQTGLQVEQFQNCSSHLFRCCIISDSRRDISSYELKNAPDKPIHEDC